MQCGRSAFGAVLVDETQADAGGQDDTDDDRLFAVSEEVRHDGSHRQQPQHRAAQLPPQHRNRAHPMSANRIGAVTQQSGRCLCTGQPAFRGIEPEQHLRHRCGTHSPAGHRRAFILDSSRRDVLASGRFQQCGPLRDADCSTGFGATLRRLGNRSGGYAVNNVSRAVDNLAEMLLSTASDHRGRGGHHPIRAGSRYLISAAALSTPVVAASEAPTRPRSNAIRLSGNRISAAADNDTAAASATAVSTRIPVSG